MREEVKTRRGENKGDATGHGGVARTTLVRIR
jgi:hypothetical protein